MMEWFSKVFDKSATLGTLIAGMGCASCFPALGSLGTALGMGFLAQFEGLFINTLLPLFAGLALAINLLSFFQHRIWYRSLLGIAGPTMVLLTLYPLWSYGWSTYLLYTGLVLMMIVAVWDLFSPPVKACCAGGRENV